MRHLRFGLLAAVALSLTGALSAQTSWTGLVSTNWDDGLNWNTGVVPTPTTDVTIPFTANQPSTYIFGPECRDLTIQGGATLSLTGGFDLVVNGDLQIDGTLDVITSSSDVEVDGDWTNNGTFNNGSGMVEFTGSGSLGGTSTTTFEDVTMAAGVRSVLANFNVDGDLNIDGGAELDLNTNTVTVDGNWTSSAASALTTGTGTVEFTGTGQMTSGFNGVPNVLISGGTRTVNPSAITGNVTLNSGTLSIADNATMAVGGSAFLNGGVLEFNSVFFGNEVLNVDNDVTVINTTAGSFSADVRILCGGDWISPSTFAPSAGIVEMDGTGTRTFSGSSPTLFNLRIASGTVNLVSETTLNGALTIDDGATLDADDALDITNGVTLGATSVWDLGSDSHIVDGNWTSSGGSASGIGGVGEVRFSGSGLVNMGGGSISNVRVSSGTRTIAGGTITGDLIMDGGQITLTDNQTLTVGDDLSFSAGNLTFNDVTAGSEILDVAGDCTILNTTSSLGASAQIHCAGDWSSDSIFAPGGGIVRLDGNTTTTFGGPSPTVATLQIANGTKTVTSATTITGVLLIDNGAQFITNAALDVQAFAVLGNNTASWDMGLQQHRVVGAWSSSGCIASNGTIEFDGDGPVATGGGSIDNVILTSGERDFAGATIAGQLTIDGGDVTVLDSTSLILSGGDLVGNGGTLSLENAAAIDANGNVDLSGVTDGTIAATSTFSFAGNWTSGASWSPANGLSVADGAGGALIGGAAPTFADLRISSNRATTAVLTVAGDLDVDAALTLGANGSVAGSVDVDAAGSIDLGGNTLSVAGDWNSGGGSATNGTVDFTGPGVLSTGGGALDQLKVTTGTRSVSSCTVNTLEVVGGELFLVNDQTLSVLGNASLTGGTVSWSTSLTGTANEILDVGGNVNCVIPVGFESTNSELHCGGNWSSNASFSPVDLFVQLDGAGTTTVGGASPTFGDLLALNGVRNVISSTTINGNLTLSTTTVDADAAIDVNGNVLLDTTSIFDTGIDLHTVQGNWIAQPGGTATATGTGTIRFDGGGTLNTNASGSIPNVEIIAGTRSVLTSTVTGDLDMSAGAVDIQNDSVLTVGGKATLSGGTLSFSDTNGTSFEILDAAEIDISASAGSMNANSLITCSGDWTSTSAFAPSDGAVFLDGGSTAGVSGTNPTFFDLVILDGVKTINSAATIQRDLTVNATHTLNLAAAIDVQRDFLASPTAVLDVGAATHTIERNWTSDGVTTAGTGTLEFTGTGTTRTGTSPIPNVLSSGGDRAMDDTTILGNLTMSGGSMTVQDNQTLGAGGSVDLQVGTVFGFDDLTAGEEKLNVAGNINIDAASGATSSNTSIAVLGNWTSAASWAPTAGTVSMAPAVSATIGGTGPKFFKLELATGMIDVLVPADIGGDLVVASDVTLTTLGALDIEGSVTLGNATSSWDIGAFTHTVAGDWTSSGGSATGAGIIAFDAAGTTGTGGGDLPETHVISGMRTFFSTNVIGDLTVFAGGATIEDDQTLHVTGHATFSGGSLGFAPSDADGGLETMDVDGDVNISSTNSGVHDANSRVFCAGNWFSDSNYAPSAGVTVLDGAGATTLDGAGLSLANVQITDGQKTVLTGTTFANLDVASGALLITNGTLDILGAFSIGDETSFWDMGALTHSVGGDWTSLGADAFNGTVDFDGDGILNTGLGSVENVVNTSNTRTCMTSEIAGDLTVNGGVLFIDDDQTLSVAGNAQLLGGTLSFFDTVQGTDEVLDVEGNSTVTLNAGTTTSSSIIRCAGDWQANGTFAPGAGRVELDGFGVTDLTGLAPGFDPTFNALFLMNGTRNATNDQRIIATVVSIDSGASLAIDGVEVVVPGGVVTVDGSLAVGPAGTLGLGATTSVVVSAGGTLRVVGDAANAATIGPDPLATGGYLVNVDGTLEASRFVFSDMGAGGVVVNEGALLGAAPEDLRAGVFTNPSPIAGSFMLDIRRPVPTEFRFVDFEDPLEVGSFNVRVLGGDDITFIDSTGNLSGEAFEIDPLGKLFWTTDPTTVTSFDATPGADIVNLDWVTTVESEVVSWILERADAGVGNYFQIAEVTAVGPSAYNFLDNTVTGLQEYDYRLSQKKTFGQIIEVATDSAIPWTAGIPANILTVGPSGAFTSIGAALLSISTSNPVISVAAGTYAPFTVNPLTGPLAGQTIRIIGDGSGPVIIDTTTGPVVIQNLGIGDEVELSDLIIGDGSSSFPGIVVQNCVGPVILDELEVHGGLSQPGIQVTGSTRTAVQRCTVDGDPGILGELGSTLVAGNGLLDEIELTGSSDARLAGLSGAGATFDAGSTVTFLPGVHADLNADEFPSLGGTLPVQVQGQAGSPFVIVASTSLSWFDLGNPFEMVGLINIFQAPILAQGITAAGITPLNFPVPADGALFGTPLPMQAVVVNPATLKFRWSNVISVIPVN